MNVNDLLFKKLDLASVKTLVNWAAIEGWNPGISDAELFYATDPDGFYGYFLDGKMIGGGSIVSYNGAYGFMGFFIVKPEYRSSGIGRKLWFQRREKLRERLKQNAPIGMDGVVAMQAFYAKGGFKIAFKDERYARTAERFMADKNISEITENDFEAVLELDKKCFGFERENFLNAWLNQPTAKTFKYTLNGRLQGFAMVRKCLNGWKVCPLFAENYTIAEALYQACLSGIPRGENLFIDIPMCNREAIKLVRNFNGEYVFECARMYFGTPPKNNWNFVFGITSFELG